MLLRRFDEWSHAMCPIVGVVRSFQCRPNEVEGFVVVTPAECDGFKLANLAGRFDFADGLMWISTLGRHEVSLRRDVRLALIFLTVCLRDGCCFAASAVLSSASICSTVGNADFRFWGSARVSS